MDFLKSVLPPLPKLPKLKRIRQWNGNSLLNLSQFHHLSAAFRMGPSNTRAESTAPTVTVTGRTDAATIERQSCTTASSRNPFPTVPAAPPHCHRRHTSDISSISATVADRPTIELTGYGNRRDNYGLYALKCDRSTAKRGILLHLPRKITQVVAGGTHDTIATTTESAPMVHEKYSPCKRGPPSDEAKIKAPPRRRKRAPAKLIINSGWTPEEIPNVMGGLQKNNSALFRIVERESTKAAALRSGGGLGVQRIRLTTAVMPTQNETSLGRQLKAHSTDNLLAVGQQESDVKKFHCKRHSRFPSTSNLPRPLPTQLQESKASSEIQPTPAVLHFRLQRATDFSIENNSEEIEVRFRRNPDPFVTSTTAKEFAESKHQQERPPLPSRAQHLRPKSVSASSCVTTINTEKGPFDSNCLLDDGSDGVRNKHKPSYVPLATVLKQSLDNELQQPTQKEPLFDSSLRRCAVTDSPRSQNIWTSMARPPNPTNSSEGSRDIFRRPACDFQEFDTIFQCSGDTVVMETSSDSEMSSAAVIKQSKCESAVPDRHTQQQLRFSSSSFSCGSTDNINPSATTAPAAPLAALPSTASIVPRGKVTETLSPNESFRSTVQIQDYSSKHQLQRVRYLSSPSPSRATLHSSEHLSPSTGNQQQQGLINSSLESIAPMFRSTIIDSDSISAKPSGHALAEPDVKNQQEKWDGSYCGGDTDKERRKVNNNLVLPLSVIEVGSICNRTYPAAGVFPTYRAVENHLKPIDQQHHVPVETGETNQHIFQHQNYGPTSEAAPVAVTAVASVTATPLSCHHRHYYHHLNSYNRNNTTSRGTDGTANTTVSTIATSVVATKTTVNTKPSTKPNDLRPATTSFRRNLIPSYDEYYSGDGIVII
ncbi:uncharacterized protein LOC126579744 [Anopheles aquasalis]|uniref:uncharacterized protein LOC126579744 n=1 Tax=Anopheles aquasalis TaxID=42839 RepID=UPI00215B3AE2|nr:uncharacterized protein LOC126579744 [Anopheles aquasalis]